MTGIGVDDGDLVIVPTRDVHKNREVIRKAAVAHGNHKIDPDSLTHPLKKIIGVIKHSLEKSLTPSDKKVSDKKSDKRSSVYAVTKATQRAICLAFASPKGRESAWVSSFSPSSGGDGRRLKAA